MTRNGEPRPQRNTLTPMPETPNWLNALIDGLMYLAVCVLWLIA